jgi:hypothetical protein
VPEGGEAAKPAEEAVKPEKNAPAQPEATVENDRKPRRPFDE